MLNKIKKNKTNILELILIFIITLLFNLICNEISGDEIWNYGFSYNIATDLIPYKDFNMIITPLFPLIGATFLNIFGKNIIVFHILGSLICTLIFYYMKKHIQKAYYIVYAILLLFGLPNYNILCILFLYILMTLENKKENDYLIGIILGMTFLTKQNIGLYLSIPTIFTKNVKRIIKRIIGFIIPNLIILIYILSNNSLYEFIDYTFLGIDSFLTKNFYIEPLSIIIITVSIIYLFYQYIKNKDIKIIYLLSFILLVLPLIEFYHTMIAFIPTFGYFINKLKLNKKIIIMAFIFFIVSNFSINIYHIYQGKYTFPNITNEYKYRKITKNEDKGIKTISNYIKNTQNELYIISRNAYLLKLESNKPINKYDLLNNGNLGKNGEIKIINEIKQNCINKKCIFLVAENELIEDTKSQYNRDIINYIINNYSIKENIKNTNMIVYSNF